MFVTSGSRCVADESPPLSAPARSQQESAKLTVLFIEPEKKRRPPRPHCRPGPRLQSRSWAQRPARGLGDMKRRARSPSRRPARDLDEPRPAGRPPSKRAYARRDRSAKTNIQSRWAGSGRTVEIDWGGCSSHVPGHRVDANGAWIHSLCDGVRLVTGVVAMPSAVPPAVRSP